MAFLNRINLDNMMGKLDAKKEGCQPYFQQKDEGA